MENSTLCRLNLDWCLNFKIMRAKSWIFNRLYFFSSRNALIFPYVYHRGLLFAEVLLMLRWPKNKSIYDHGKFHILQLTLSLTHRNNSPAVTRPAGGPLFLALIFPLLSSRLTVDLYFNWWCWFHSSKLRDTLLRDELSLKKSSLDFLNLPVTNLIWAKTSTFFLHEFRNKIFAVFPRFA